MARSKKTVTLSKQDTERKRGQSPFPLGTLLECYSFFRTVHMPCWPAIPFAIERFGRNAQPRPRCHSHQTRGTTGAQRPVQRGFNGLCRAWTAAMRARQARDLVWPARANDGAKWQCSKTGHGHSSRRDSSSEAQGKSTRAKRALTQPWGQVSRFTPSPKGTALIPMNAGLRSFVENTIWTSICAKDCDTIASLSWTATLWLENSSKL